MKEKKCGIYKVTNIVNAKVIIGLSRNIYDRWYYYKKFANEQKHWNCYFQEDWNKYGEESFRFEIILECPREKLNEEEIRLIKEYDSMDKNKGYNIAPGGYSHAQAEETKKKISISHMGSKNWNYGNKMPEEQKQKLIKSHSGVNNYGFGKHISKEAKQKMRWAHLGKKASEETRRKLSAIHLGRKASEETRQKRLLSGYRHSEETRKKISEKAKIQWATNPPIVAKTKKSI